MNFKKIVIEGLEETMNDLKNMTPPENEEQPNNNPSPAQPKPITNSNPVVKSQPNITPKPQTKSSYEIMVNGKPVISAISKEDLIRQIQNLP